MNILLDCISIEIFIYGIEVPKANSYIPEDSSRTIRLLSEHDFLKLNAFDVYEISSVTDEFQLKISRILN
jgi:hypothetical protein